MLKLLLRSLGAEECLTRKCWPMDELALLSSSIRWRKWGTGHIQICKQDIAGCKRWLSFSQTLETRSCEFCDSNPEADVEQCHPRTGL